VDPADAALVCKLRDGVERDEHPRPDTSLEKLSALEPAFRAAGTVTAGNSSGIVDGAAGVLIASKRAVKELGLRPRYTLHAGLAHTWEWYRAQGLTERPVDFSFEDQILSKIGA